jgi:hypothetical protein
MGNLSHFMLHKFILISFRIFVVHLNPTETAANEFQSLEVPAMNQDTVMQEASQQTKCLPEAGVNGTSKEARGVRRT